jgi:hypothetical protein
MTDGSSPHAFALPDLDPELEPAPVPGDPEPEPVSPAGAVPGSPEPAPEPVPVAGAVPGSPEPVQGQFPELVPGGTAGTSGTITRPVPVIEVPADRISRARQMRLWLLDRARAAGQHQKRHRTFLHWLWNIFWNSPPESLADHRKHLQSRRWLENYMTGWVRGFAEWENVIYGVTLARTVKAVCQTIDRIFQRQSRFWILVALVILAFIIRSASHH